MVAIYTFALLAALASPGQAVLLDFSAEWCGPCRSMEPTVRRLIAEGYVIRPVDIDREPALARQFGVDRVPTFVMLAGGREVNRTVGPVGYAQLKAWFERVGVATPPAVARGPAALPAAPTALAAAPPAPTAARTDANPQAVALQATVRLRIDDPKGVSLGTGTIIYVTGDRALVMTCGHIFRESQGHGPVVVELFGQGAVQAVPGEVLHYDLQHDVGLVMIRPGRTVTPVRVAPADYAVQRGDRVFTIGCDQGAAPSIRESHVIALNRYVGAANIEVAGHPVVGRSGGGLFSADGQLIGVCNLANVPDNEGIYAALSLLHQNLDKKQLSYVYQRNPSAGLAGAVPSQPRTDLALQSPPAMPAQMPRTAAEPAGQRTVPLPFPLTSGAVADNAPATAGAEDLEMIVILRSRRNPTSAGNVFLVTSPSRDVLNWLATEDQQRRRDNPVVLQATGAGSAVANQPPDRWSQRDTHPVVRAQAGR